MSVGHESLADYVRRVVNEKGLNYREVARRSGGLITHSAVHDVINGRSKDPKVSTLIGLAKGLDVPEDEVFAVARGLPATRSHTIKEATLLTYFGSLPKDKQDDLLTYAEMMYQRHGKGTKKRA